MPRSDLISKNIEMGHINQRSEIELARAFMPVLVTAALMMSRSKMNELAWRHHYKSMGNVLDLKGS